MTEIEETQAWMRDFFSTHRELTPEEKRQRTAAIRGIAERSREDAAARSYTEWIVEQIKSELPMEAQVFRACYLGGASRPTARQVGHDLNMDKRSVYRCICRVLDAALPLVFGLGGLYAICSRE